MLDGLFSQSFELYPNETIQAKLAISGENIAIATLYTKITAKVSYHIYGTKTKVHYDRTITFSEVYDTKVFYDVNMDLKELESSLKDNTKETVRTANYLDGNQVAVFDELNIIAGKSLQNDISSAIESTKKEIIKDRTKTIEEYLSKINCSE
jgi:hypothetical protein